MARVCKTPKACNALLASLKKKIKAVEKRKKMLAKKPAKKKKAKKKR